MSTNGSMLGNGDGVGINIMGTIWKQIVYAVAADSIRTYLNGQLIYSAPFIAGINFNNAYPIRFGKASNPYWGDYAGALDDIRIYNRTISAKEVDTLFHENGWIKPISKPIPSGAWSIAGTSWTNHSLARTASFNLCTILPSGPFTIEMWVYPDSAYYMAYFNAMQASAEARVLLVTKNDPISEVWRKRTGFASYPAFYPTLNPVRVGDADTLPRNQWSQLPAFRQVQPRKYSLMVWRKYRFLIPDHQIVVLQHILI